MSRKERKRRKGGRAPAQGAREPNGRLSRKRVHIEEREEMTMREAQSVVIQARMRHTGLSEAAVSMNDAGRPNAGTPHGILHLRGEITREQWDAAEWWRGTRIAWLRSIEASAVSGGGARSGEFDEASHARWCASLADTWEAVTDCIRDASVESRSPLAAALDVILFRQEIVPHLIGDFRLACNAIHRRFLRGARKAA